MTPGGVRRTHLAARNHNLLSLADLSDSLRGAGFSGDPPFGAVSSGRNHAVLDEFAILELARQAKADTRLEFDTRASAWPRFLPIPCIDGGVRHRCYTCDLVGESCTLSEPGRANSKELQ